ncbi:MAG TPA: hypothetical protein P5121_28300, partial [Caldilineaceae bacterium]|nr:hypothetical protein [Caldilineaceae bacterium]
TPTQVAQCKPTITITITSRPSPPHPGRPLIYLIRIKVTEDCGIRGLRLFATIPLFTIYNDNSSAQNVAALENAGWQCPFTTAGSICELVVGDLAANADKEVEFPVTVDSAVTMGTSLNLKVTAIDADGNSQSGTSGVDYSVVVEPFEIMLPLVNK